MQSIRCLLGLRWAKRRYPADTVGATARRPGSWSASIPTVAPPGQSIAWVLWTECARCGEMGAPGPATGMISAAVGLALALALSLAAPPSVRAQGAATSPQLIEVRVGDETARTQRPDSGFQRIFKEVVQDTHRTKIGPFTYEAMPTRIPPAPEYGERISFERATRAYTRSAFELRW